MTFWIVSCMMQVAEWVHQLGVEGGARAFLQELLGVFLILASNTDGRVLNLLHCQRRC